MSSDNRVVSVFPDTHMGLGHLGLAQIAKKGGRPVEALAPGRFVLFINRAQTAFKLFAANRTIVYYKSERGRIDMRAIAYIPQAFNGSEFVFDRAIEKVLDKHLKKK